MKGQNSYIGRGKDQAIIILMGIFIMGAVFILFFSGEINDLVDQSEFLLMMIMFIGFGVGIPIAAYFSAKKL